MWSSNILVQNIANPLDSQYVHAYLLSIYFSQLLRQTSLLTFSQGSSLFCYYVTCKWEQSLTWDRRGRTNQILVGQDRQLWVGPCSTGPPLQRAVFLANGGFCSAQTQGPVTQGFLIWIRVWRQWREEEALCLCWLLCGGIFTLFLQQGLKAGPNLFPLQVTLNL